MKDVKLDKRVYDIRGMMELGYKERTIRKLIKSDHFSEYGFRIGASRNSKAYFILPKVERFIESQMDEYGEVRG